MFVESREGEAARTPRRSRVRACVCVAKPAMGPKQQQRPLLFSEKGMRTVAPKDKEKKTRVRTRRAPRALQLKAATQLEQDVALLLPSKGVFRVVRRAGGLRARAGGAVYVECSDMGSICTEKYLFAPKV